ncbi:MAG: hypothetical protein HY744_05750 [Deltaproteobacteria bacterium]|nr:hypothetical protein [Deltaproteobacteria bacterium]
MSSWACSSERPYPARPLVPGPLALLLALGCAAPAPLPETAGGTPAPLPTVPVAPVATAPPEPSAAAPPPTLPARATLPEPPESEPPPELPPGAGSPPLGFRCQLRTPAVSEDPCRTDADCGPSAPCHAPACVARDKSRPPTPDTRCTMSYECHTADANRCGCYQGRCALVPPGS